MIALGGSTNAVLHLLAMANAANVKLNLDDFTKIRRGVPVLAGSQTGAENTLMSELVSIGGQTPLMKMLLAGGIAPWRLHDRDRPH